jgi:DNA-binding CsgD family transcriptional regulator
MYAYNLKEIGDFLGIHYTTVSKIVSRNRKK